MTDDGLHFDAATHRYTYRGRRLPSVTELLARYGITAVPDVSPAVLERARLRGQAVHHAIHQQHLGQFDARTLDPALEGYLFAWEAFVQATGYESRHVERSLCDPTLGVAGTLDDAGFYPPRNALAIVDRKCVAIVQSGTAVQLAGYRLLLRANGEDAPCRLAVQLCPDGTFTVHEYRDPLDEVEFRAAALLYHRHVARHGEEPR